MMINGTIILVSSWMSDIKAKALYADTPAWDANSVPNGRSAHIGGGKWISRCSHCDAFCITWGMQPRYSTIGKHEIAAHEGAQVPGINVGILA